MNLVPFVIILLAIGIYAIVLFSRLANRVDATVSQNYGSVTAAQTMSLALSRMQTGVLLVFEDKKAAGRAIFEENKNLFEKNVELQALSRPAAEEMELRRQLNANYAHFRQAGEQIFSLAQRAEQRRVYDEDFYLSALTTGALLEQFRALNQKAIQATGQNLQTLARDVTRLMVIGIIVALAIASYACYQLGRAILLPIQSLTRATHELGEGNLDQLVPVLSQDELGQLAVSFNKMAAQLQTYRQSAQEKIVRLHRTMESTLASFPDPIFVLDKQSRIELMNPAAEELVARLHLDRVLPGHLQAISQKILESGQSFLPDSFKEVISFRLGGQEKFFLPRILAMRDKEEALFGVGVVLYDVTRFRLLDDAKTNLVATVSHELKTPLTSVRMVLHLLLEKTIGPLTPKQNELVHTARDDVERLLRILNDLLDLTRLEEGHTELHLETVASPELVRNTIDEMREAVAAADLKIDSECEGDPPAVWADCQRIRLVFTNLVSNAIKHSPSNGDILLRVAQTPIGDVQFSVLDQGPGVADEYKSRIFDRFFRVPGQKKTGAGLGLSIAREIVLAHGGRIGVKNRPGQGSEFFFVLKAVLDTAQ